MAEIRITIDKIGKVKMDAEGFTGEACRDATGSFEQALAGVEVQRDLKSEYYDTPAESGVDAENMRM
jgi:hypothetical protein